MTDMTTTATASHRFTCWNCEGDFHSTVPQPSGTALCGYCAQDFEIDWDDEVAS